MRSCLKTNCTTTTMDVELRSDCVSVRKRIKKKNVPCTDRKVRCDGGSVSVPEYAWFSGWGALKFVVLLPEHVRFSSCMGIGDYNNKLSGKSWRWKRSHHQWLLWFKWKKEVATTNPMKEIQWHLGPTLTFLHGHLGIAAFDHVLPPFTLSFTWF